MSESNVSLSKCYLSRLSPEELHALVLIAVGQVAPHCRELAEDLTAACAREAERRSASDQGDDPIEAVPIVLDSTLAAPASSIITGLSSVMAIVCSLPASNLRVLLFQLSGNLFSGVRDIVARLEAAA